MRVVVASDIELGSHRAHAINVVKTAGGFARLGHQVRVLLRSPGAVDTREVMVGYGEQGLDVELAPTLPAGRTEVHSGARQREFGAWVAERAVSAGADLVYARHFEAGLAAARLGLPTVLETHAYAGDLNPALGRALDATRTLGLSIVTISPTLRAHFLERGAAAERVGVVADGVDVEMFAAPPCIGRAPWERGRWAAHAVYAGHLYDYKGIPTVLEAARLLPDVCFELVGGTPEDVERTRGRAAGLENVRIHGMREYREIPRWLWHADVLLLPPSGREASAAWTSPVKLGEYLAAGAPIAASRIPGLLTWVQEPAVYWFAPDDAGSLAGAVRAASGESGCAGVRRRAAALQLAHSFSYRERARHILEVVRGGALAGAAA
jgi:glycosyltransferase involved in cell wall biosynthesis